MSEDTSSTTQETSQQTQDSTTSETPSLDSPEIRELINKTVHAAISKRLKATPQTEASPSAPDPELLKVRKENAAMKEQLQQFLRKHEDTQRKAHESEVKRILSEVSTNKLTPGYENLIRKEFLTNVQITPEGYSASVDGVEYEDIQQAFDLWLSKDEHKPFRAATKAPLHTPTNIQKPQSSGVNSRSADPHSRMLDALNNTQG